MSAGRAFTTTTRRQPNCPTGHWTIRPAKLFRAFDAIRAVATDVGFDKITTQVGQHPKVKLRSTFVGGEALQGESRDEHVRTITSTTHRHSTLRCHQPMVHGRRRYPDLYDRRTHSHQDPGLFQRRKGRDLFDLWLLIIEMPDSTGSDDLTNVSGKLMACRGEAES
jgi:hypothetical protein